MNIIEAAKAMKNGHKITRNKRTRYRYDEDEGILVSNGRDDPWRVAWYDGAFCSLEELLADDWEIVE